MEITNEIKAKVFALYLGKPCNRKMYYASDGSLHNDGVMPLDIVRLDHLDQPPSINIGKVVDKLILKPLSRISADELLQICQLYEKTAFGLKDQSSGNIQFKFFMPSGVEGTMSINVNYSRKATQWLIDNGFDTRQYLLGDKTLFECELCTYEDSSI